MARLTRQTLNVFAGSATNQGTFGSAQASSPATSTSPTTVQSLAAWANGWLSAVIGGQKLPPLEEFQGVQFVHSYMSAYLFQEGVAEYDSGTTYFQHSIVKKTGTYQIYGSVTDANVGNALTNPTYWTLLQDLSAPSAAQVAYGLTTNSTNAYSVTTTPAITAPTAGMLFEIKFNAANTGGITLNVGGSGAVTCLDRDGNAIISGSIVANRDYLLIYNGTNFIFSEGFSAGSSYGVTTNSGNTYSVTTTPTFSSLVTGQLMVVTFNAANTGAITLNPNTIGATTVQDASGNALASGALMASKTYLLAYDGTNLRVITAINLPVLTVKKQIFTSGGTYTPSTGMLYCIAEVLAGGGGGGGANGSAQTSGGGGGGAYSKAVLTAATVGASQTITIGAGGTAGSTSGGTGGTGGTSSLGSIISCSGGIGGTGGTSSSGSNAYPGGTGGTSSGGDINGVGGTGLWGWYNASAIELSGSGADSLYGGGGLGVYSSAAGNAATGYGAGGGGAWGSSKAGGAGSPGVIYITEFCSQ